MVRLGTSTGVPGNSISSQQTFLRSTSLSQVCLNEVEEFSAEGLLPEEPTHEEFNGPISAVQICPPTNDELSQLEELKTIGVTRKNASSVSEELERAEERAAICGEIYLPPVTSSDSRSERAFKQVFDELMSRRQASKWSVARWHWTGDNQRRHDCRPSLADFAGDIFLAAKEVLTLKHYRILTAFAKNEFRNWDRVPEGIRHDIQGRVGASFLRKRIIFHDSTRSYWQNISVIKRAA